MSSDNSSSSELPCELPECYSAEKDFKKDSIVWAKYRKFHWPAIVRNVDVKRRRAGILFIDSIEHGGRSIMMSTKNIITFNSKKGLDLLKQDIQPAKLASIFKSTVNDVQLFFYKAVGHSPSLSPIEYFKALNDSSKVLTAGEEKEEEKVEKKEEKEIHQPESSHDHSGPSGSNVMSPEDQEEEDDSSDADSAEETFVTLEEKIQILSHLESSECEAYLSKLIVGKETCDRHNIFLTANMETRKQMKLQGARYVEVYQDPKFLDNITKKFRSLLEKNMSPDLEKKINSTSYLFDVIIPQATIWSLAKINNTSMEEAELEFNILPSEVQTVARHVKPKLTTPPPPPKIISKISKKEPVLNKITKSGRLVKPPTRLDL